MRLFIVMTSLVGGSVCLSSVHADFLVPEFRGSGNSTYQEWNIFASATEPNFPDVADSNSNGSASLQELTGGAFITSGGNIYSPALQASFEITVPDFDLGASYSTTVVLQIRTQGSSLDLESILLDGMAPNEAELLYEEPLGGFGGLLQDWKFEWHSIGGSFNTNTIHFDASESSMSLDRVAVDTLTELIYYPSVLAARVVHAGFSGSGQGPFEGLDLEKVLVSRGDQDVLLTLANIVSSSHGINGIALDFQGLDDVNDLQWDFTISPQGAFDLQQNPISSWQIAQQPASITQFTAQGDLGSDRLVVTWPNLVIADRYLRVRVSENGRLLAEFFLGHLTGKTVETSGDVFTVSFADISPIRSTVGASTDASNPLDINKDGTVSFGDISAMRHNVGTQLTRLRVPALGT